VAPLAVLGVLVLLLVAAPSAMASWLTPEHDSGSRNADSIHTLYVIALAIGAIIFALVEGVLVYSLIRFRKRRGGPEAAQMRGNTPLEVGWTLGAAGIITLLAALTFVYLNGITEPERSSASVAQGGGGVQLAALDQAKVPGGRDLKVRVNGQQYLWRYDYPPVDGKQVFSYHDMYVPVGTTVTLKITASDVAHSWWIPDMGGKADAIPGHTNETWFKADKTGTYEGECAELCGTGHADMRARVIVLPQDEFQAWLERQAADIRAAQAKLSLSRQVRGESSP
jgi:cytochrome c oxidase subunit 2